MNVKHFLMIFSMITLVLILTVNFKIDSLASLNQKTSLYNETIDNAVDDSLNTMLEVTDSFTHQINLKTCSTNFFKSLYAGFDLIDSPTGRVQLSMYVPILVVTDEDGFYIMYHSVSNDEQYTVKEWTPKMPYCYSNTLKVDSGEATPTIYNYTINFTMSDVVQINFTKVAGDGTVESYYVDGNYNTLLKENVGNKNYAEIEKFYNAIRASGEPLSDNRFAKLKKSAIIYQITKKANYYVNRHNSIAEAYGVTYNFTLPESSMDSFARTIDDVSMLAMFQGYPYGKGTNDVYTRFSVSGARLFKHSRYYVFREGDVCYYHRENCDKVKHFDKSKKYEIFNTREQCAQYGAYPCPDCKP